MQKRKLIIAGVFSSFLFVFAAQAFENQWDAISTVGSWVHSASYSVLSSSGVSCPFDSVSGTDGVSYGGFIYPYDRRVMRTKDDFDGDGKSDCWFYHDSQVWYIIYSSATQTVSRLAFGLENAISIPEDYDGDHLTDYAVYQESSGIWVALPSSLDYTSVSMVFGGPGYSPLAADFDGDQKADLAVYHRASGVWSVMQSANGYAVVSGSLGGTGYTALAGDYDEDDKADPVVYNEALGYFEISMSGSSTVFRRSPYSIVGASYGGPGFSLLADDYDGDGCADLAAYDRASGLWYVINYKLNPIIWGLQWGGTGYKPIQGDFDGDGLADASVFYRDLRDTIWSLNESTDGPQTLSARSDRPRY
ncbi:FG-GAP repeat domain-containing protein [Verrucomicrobiota bacterium]